MQWLGFNGATSASSRRDPAWVRELLLLLLQVLLGERKIEWMDGRVGNGLRF